MSLGLLLLLRHNFRRNCLLQVPRGHDLELSLLVDPHLTAVEEALDNLCGIGVLFGPVLRLDQLSLQPLRLGHGLIYGPLPGLSLHLGVLHLGLRPPSLGADLQQLMATTVAHYADTDASHKPLGDEGDSLTANLVTLLKHPFDLWVHGYKHVIVSGHLLVAVVLLPLGPFSEVVAAYGEDDVDNPLARQLCPLLGVREVLLHLWVMRGLLHNVSDTAAFILRYVKVPDLAALNVLLQAANDVYTDAHGQQQVLTLEKVYRHRVVGRQIGLDVDGQKLERVFLAFVLGAELSGRYLSSISNFHGFNSGVQLYNYKYDHNKHVSAAHILVRVNHVCSNVI